ncbi:acylneuraminate cytidylyltransferase family protein [Herbaspirillum seropedicae]|uniref:acylneuraminate cytidylyltransferase family protein n=1 Tax=Herbaspirillum seropedicae TaxID=964 RepID=UPI003F8D63FA
MKILALIPARGGSKRLPGKNVRLLGGKPLIEWSIDAARSMDAITDVVVSTDDPGIAALARRAGASVPGLRPAALATDTASSVDVAVHALAQYEDEHGQVDGLLLLQPTSPFRSHASLHAGLALFNSQPGCSVVGVSPVATHPLWCFRLEQGKLQPFVEGGGLHLRSQDLPPAYTINGGFYLVPADVLRNSRSLYAPDMLPLIMDSPMELIDIDTEQDWQRAEQILATLPTAR